jgi:hypothetical protein
LQGFFSIEPNRDRTGELLDGTRLWVGSGSEQMKRRFKADSAGLDWVKSGRLRLP